MRKLFQRVISVLVIAVVFQLLVHEAAVVFGRPWSERLPLILLGVALDLVFVTDFLVRLYLSIIRRKGLYYLGHGRGWADFLSTVPVWLFFSGPVLYGLLAGGIAPFGSGELMHPLLTARMLQSLTVFRLFRLWKLFPEPAGGRSDMLGRHIAKIMGLFLTAVVLGFFGSVLLSGLSAMVSPLQASVPNAVETAHRIQVVSRAVGGSADDRNTALRRVGAARQIAENEAAVLVLRHAGRTAYTRTNNHGYNRDFGPGDYLYAVSGEYEVFIDVRSFHADSAGLRLVAMLVALAGLLTIGMIYGRHFATTVRDPLQMMARGLRGSGDSLPVHVPRAYARDEVFLAAQAYNSTLGGDRAQY